MINRKTGPIINKIDKLLLPDYELHTLPNGIKVCEINSGSQDIIKFEIFHKAGRAIEDHHLAGRAVSSLIKDGTATKNSAELSEAIDYFGASIKSASNMDYSYCTLYSLTKHFGNVIPVLHDMYHHPIFPEDETEKFKNLNIQKLREELSKNEVLAYRKITEEIYGTTHPYGYNSTEADYTSLTSDMLKDHFQNYYGSDNCHIFISGRITDEIRKVTADLFGSEHKISKKKNYAHIPSDVLGRKINITTKNEHQCALKTGHHLFNKNHPDHAAFFLLNVVFGGYFGSRLMMSIREEKGYTYDISSNMDQYLYDGCFYVSTEADPGYIEPILSEVHHQMDLLCQEKIGDKELDMVKNYLMGTFLNMLDGPMNTSSVVKSMILTDKRPEDFIAFSQELVQMPKERIMEVAQKYFKPKDFIEVIVSPE
ncbi:MAG: insulinase family protein [Saprospiraceae bacterium]|jgi:zinc protease|nr:insulinase family protein [Saprospiraceae bacterium]